jgi:exonuclease SbcC
MTNLYLKNISLRQFRSFSKLDVELPAQAGVLIVHGSNGLGKSSLFDALEWSLSDSIDHFRGASGVDKPGTYLCRWREGEPGPTSAAMTFSDESTIERRLLSETATESTLEGSVDNVTEFLRAPTWQQNISDLRRYLLLTHFLGQSTLSRLTYRKSTERFEILKEASQSKSIEAVANAIHGQGNNTTVSAYSRQIKAFERDAKNLSDLLEQEAALWTETQISGAIDDASARSMARQIADQLIDIQLFDAKASDALGAGVQLTIQTLRTEIDRIDGECLNAEGMLERGRQLEGAHRRAKLEIAELAAKHSSAEEQSSILRGQLDSARAKQIDSRKKLAVCQSAKAEADRSISHLFHLRDARERVAKLSIDHLASLAERKSAVKVKIAAENDVAHGERKLQILLRLSKEIHQCDREIHGLADDISTIKEAMSHDGRIREQVNLVAELEASNPQVNEKVILAEKAAANATERFKIHSAATEALRETVNAMSKAIASIAINLPADTCDCPLCATHFDSASALQTNVMAAAQRLAPTLAVQEEELQKLATSRDQRIDELRQVQAAQLAIRSARKTLDEEQKFHVQLLSRLDPGSSEQEIELEKRAEQLGERFSAVNAKRLRKSRWQTHPCLTQGSSDDERAKATRVRDKAQLSLDAVSRTLADLAAVLERAKSDELQAISAVDVVSEISRDELAAIVAEKEVAVRNLQNEVNSASQVLTEVDENVASIEVDQVGLRTRLLEIGKRKAELDDAIRRNNDDWLELRQFGPTQDLAAVISFEQRIAEVRLSTKKAAGLLNRLREGRVAWSKQLSHRAVVEKIRQHIDEPPNKPREELLASAMSRRAQLEAAAEAVRQVKEIAKAASADISIELEEFNAEYIKPLGFLMSQINQAILCDPRVGIDLHVKKKKIEQSAVKGSEVPKSVGAVDPILVHSEGQMAALAVSMLTAANLTFPWSRWKALILDDPLQHNDSIHSAAFADMVGNLVTAEGYQVLLSTHDVAQAEFLQRKFRSRNIPCTTLNLLGLGKDGVKWSVQSSSPNEAQVASAK